MVGASNQTMPASNLEVGNAVRNRLFTNAHKDTLGKKIPGDLVSRNIQRGRDHGIPGYAVLRAACGLANLTNSIEAPPPEINSTIWKKLLNTYKNDSSQIDGFTGGLAETSPSDGQVNSKSLDLVRILINRWGPFLPAS